MRSLDRRTRVEREAGTTAETSRGSEGRKWRAKVEDGIEDGIRDGIRGGIRDGIKDGIKDGIADL
jgi:hypothetical protein